MAAGEDDVDSGGEDNILYDLAVLAEWKFDNEIFTRCQKRQPSPSFIGQLSAAAQRGTWSFLRKLGLKPLEATPCLLPEPLISLISSTLPWHLAVSSSGSLAAVLQESSIEIRSHRDGFESVVGRGSVPPDPHPQWRCLAWSPEESMVACSRSSGVVDVFDIVGTLLFTIGKSGVETSGISQDLSSSVTALIFTDLKPADKQWSAELLVIHHSGILHSYLVDRDSGFKANHHFLLSDEYPHGVAAAVYDAQHKILFVGGDALPQKSECCVPSRCEGVTAWRVLSDTPHYKLLSDLDGEQNQHLKKKSWLKRLWPSSMFSWSSSDVDGVAHLCLSSDSSVLVGLHHSGCLTIWDCPSLRLRHRIPLNEQPGYDEVNAALAEDPAKRKKLKDLVPHRKLVDVNFWSDKAIILARCSGAVTVSSLSTLRNLLGTSPEWFEPSPRITEAHDGGFLGLECELRFPRHRILGDEEDDSDDEDVTMVAMTTRATKQILYYLTDSERFQPPKRKPRTVTKVYRMVWLKSTTPEELYARKIDAEEYGEALALAQAYGLDCDLVYQRQWRRSPVSIASIQDYLSKISKRAWVLHECQERVPDGIDAARELLQYGLRGTDLPALAAIPTSEDAGRFMLCDPDDGLYQDADFDPFNQAAVEEFENKKRQLRKERLAQITFDNLTLEQKELIRVRQKLLQYLDRLKTYERILGGGSVAAERFNAEFYKDFRSRNIVELAVHYAQNSDWQALEILFTFHHDDLIPHRLAILSNFPETTSPGEYKSLLPELGNDGVECGWEAESWREEDWCELPVCRSSINICQDDLGSFLYEKSPELLKYRTSTLDMALTQEWYEVRACQMEEKSRLVDNALELIKLAIQHGFDGLGELLDDLITMETLVYECGVGEWLSIRELREMSEYTRIELMMEKSPLEMYAKNIRRWVVPVLERCEQRERGAYRRLLREFLLTRSRTDLVIPLQIFQTSKTGVANPVIKSPHDLMEFALDVIYTTERDDQLEVAVEIFKCLPQKGLQLEMGDVGQLEKDVDRLERHLRAAKILQDHEIQKTVAYIKMSENDVEEANSLIVKMTRLAGRKSPPLREVQWYKLHSDIMALQDIVYRCLSPSLCHQIFVESLLCSGSNENIKLAGELMERRKHTGYPLGGNGQIQRLDYDTAVSLVLTAAKEYFNSSANLTHSCMDLARSCLNLILDSPPPIQEEMDLITSLAILDDFSVSILPLQVRMCKNRLDLVHKAVASKPSNYKQSQKLLRLAHLLRVEARDSAECDSKVLMLLTQAALAAGDTTFAYQCCQQLMTANYPPAWTVCVDLAEQESFKDVQAKISLLSFAVTFCTPQMIEPILLARSLLQRQLQLENVSKVLTQEVENQQTGMHDSGEEITHKGREGSPFSARAALRQTQEILSSTQRKTKAVLSSVTDTAWWKEAVNALKLPTYHKTPKKGDCDYGNSGFNKQGCHPFYETVVDNCHLDTSTVDYGVFETKKSWEKIDSVDIGTSVLRAARLEEMLTEGEKNEPAEEALLGLAQKWLPCDTSLGLAYLLSLPKAEAADRCFSILPNTGLVLEIAQYYYSLQIYALLKPCIQSQPASLYLRPPSRIAHLVLHHLSSHPDKKWPPKVASLLPLLETCHTRLKDWHQGQSLQRLAPGIDVNRFASDKDYQRETILGLAMSCEQEMIDMAMSLAERYQMPLWDIYMVHLEFLFTDSGLSTEELRQRATSLNILDTLKQQPKEFCSRLYSQVYPGIVGSDHSRLLYLFSLLEGIDAEHPLCGISAAEHIKLLKKLKTFASDIDYVRLMDDKTPPKDCLAPYLNSSNINNVIKLAARIPDKKGGFLHPSALYCGWAIRVFWEGDKPAKSAPQNSAAWVHRYEQCGEYLQKLLPDDFYTFTVAIVCSRDSCLKLEVSCRQEILRRAIKFCSQQRGRRKKDNVPGVDSEWETVEAQLSPLQAHLQSLDTDTLRSFLQAEDPKFRQYALLYDMSCGDPQKVVELLETMVIDGQPLELLEDLLQVAPPAGFTVADILEQALKRIVSALRGCEDSGERKIYDPLQRLEEMLQNVQGHIENEGQLTSRQQVVDALHPFVTDSTLAMKQRLPVLEILEKTVGLGREHMGILLWCKTLRLVEPAWPDMELFEDGVETEDGRKAVFEKLLAASSLASHFQTICHILELWPPFEESSGEENPWKKTLLTMAASSNLATVTLIDTVLKDLGPASFPLNIQDTKLLFDVLLRCRYTLEGVKVILRSGHKKLYPSAVLVLSAEEEVDGDGDLVDLVLRCCLTPQLAGTPIYASVTQEVLRTHETQGATALPHKQLETVLGQLQEAGLQSEAKSLMQQAQKSRPLLRSMGSAFGAMGSWFKS
ncbi:neuroblastoma-amplified sequence-like [Pomacea canaliculata]|uniref:neuroblastoma-amplified sequence-like n=1 Tax=Pomacea canaliculata TaxID=400727 RepID=UPI000D7363CE|nr:neuroblastoma-amplified sequence-like [Pomacea canaliculata]